MGLSPISTFCCARYHSLKHYRPLLPVPSRLAHEICPLWTKGAFWDISNVLAQRRVANFTEFQNSWSTPWVVKRMFMILSRWLKRKPSLGLWQSSWIPVRADWLTERKKKPFAAADKRGEGGSRFFFWKSDHSLHNWNNLLVGLGFRSLLTPLESYKRKMIWYTQFVCCTAFW